MAEIRPFRGVRYDPSNAGDLASVICPPYDIIPPEMQDELYRRSEFNFIRLEYGRGLPQDTPQDNRYTRAATTLREWLTQGVLKAEDSPALYLHDHYFSCGGKEYRRRGMIVRVRLEEWEKRVVHLHEDTLSQPKSDRLNLMRALQGNTSPVLALYEDRKRYVSSLLVASARCRPEMSIAADGERHEVWTITESEVIDQVRSSLASQPLYIADGHHRYESALAYRWEQLVRFPDASPGAGFDFVMMALVDFADPGLVILPPHRLVRGIPKPTLDGLMSRLKAFFEVGGLSRNTPDAGQRVGDFLAGGAGEVRVVLFGPGKEQLFLLRLTDFAATDPLMPASHSGLYRRLDVSIVDHVIVEKLLGMGAEEKALLAYSHESHDAVRRVLDGEYQLTILLRPVRAETIKAIADAGDRMPRKSTYFYPKAPSGLVFYRFAG